MSNLVQRIRGSVASKRLNIDARFQFDYMGATEFECGILFASLKLMRQRECQVQEININGTSLWFCGDLVNLTAAKEFASSQLNGSDPNERLKEPTRMKTSVSARNPTTIGWWWLSQDGWPDKDEASKPTWVLFLREDDARSWAECCLRKVRG